MKKVLGIVILGLLWCNITFAKIIELDQGVKIKIPDGYEYVQFKRLEFMRAKAGEWGELSKSQFDKFIDEQQTLLGMNGTETSTIIVRKEYKDSYIDFINHVSTGKSWKGWPGMRKIANKCANKKSQKSVVKCIVDTLKMDPIIQINLANDISKDPVLMPALKEFGKIENSGEDRIMGIGFKKTSYFFLHNENIFLIEGSCMSKKNCKNIKNLKNKIIEPFLSMKSKKEKKPENVDNNDLIKKIKELNDLYKSGVLTKEEFEKAKKKLLN
tara:strand:- start:47 stop:856 length:810 start_codon:yes stop_codon:yes gene_type:complete